jgi:hypothetical protein
LKINEKEYIDINKHWDLADSADKENEELNDWSSWILRDE